MPAYAYMERSLKFGIQWATQLRITQAIGRPFSQAAKVDLVLVPGGIRDIHLLETGDLDLIFPKSIHNEHRYTGKGLYAANEPLSWLRTIAWFPQEDRLLFALAPWVDASALEEIGRKKLPLKMSTVGQGPETVLQAYGFSYQDIASWGGRVESMGHRWQDAKQQLDKGSLDACFGDTSAHGTCWRWLAGRGYRFVGISEEALDRLVREQGLRRAVTPAGFLSATTENLLTLDDSHIVLTCHAHLAEDYAYLLAKVIDEHRQEIECSSVFIDYDEEPHVPLVRQIQWSSMTSRIEKQWDARILGAPLHPGALRYYREQGYIE